MTNKEDNTVIDFMEELKRRNIKVPGIKRVRVDPKNDSTVKLAMDILSLIRDKESDMGPVNLIAALQIVGNILSTEYLKAFGRDRATRLVVVATSISDQYQPVYKTTDEG